MTPFKLALAALAVAWGTTAAAHAGSPVSYVEVDLGAPLGGDFHASGQDVLLGPVSVNETLRRGWTAGLLAGRQVGAAPIYVEAEGLYLNDAIKSADLNAVLGQSAGLRTGAYAGLVNLKYEQPLRVGASGPQIAPYVAAGVGYGSNSISILGDHYDGDGLVWQAKAGLAIRTSARLTWDVGYRYVRLPTFDTNKLGLAARMQTDAHVLGVGLRYAFGDR